MTKDEKFERLAEGRHEGAAEMIPLDTEYDEGGRWHKPKLPSGAWRGLLFALLFEAIILLAWWLAWRVI